MAATKPGTPLIIELGRMITQRRTEQQMTQLQLSKASGITRRTIANLETGQSGCSLATYIKICFGLGYSSLDMLADSRVWAAALKTPTRGRPRNLHANSAIAER